MGGEIDNPPTLVYAAATMYLEHFGLREFPFSLAPDPRYLYLSAQHREALAHLLYGVRSEGGFVQLTGEVGTGKTTVCRCFLEQLPPDTRAAVLLNPCLGAEELLAAICDEFAIERPLGASGLKDSLDRINRFLLEVHASGGRAVLVVDEAQNLDAAVLEQVRLLTNLETSRHKLLQIILMGQPELRATLARPELRQLAQRVTARFHLRPLTRGETVAYVRHRLGVAGCHDELFPESVVGLLRRLSRGIPRLINILCDRALLGAFVQGKHLVDAATLRQAAREVAGEPGIPGLPWRLPALAGAILAGALLLVSLMHREDQPTGVPEPAPAKVPARAAAPAPPTAAVGEAGRAPSPDGSKAATAVSKPAPVASTPAGGPLSVATATVGPAPSPIALPEPSPEPPAAPQPPAAAAPRPETTVIEQAQPLPPPPAADVPPASSGAPAQAPPPEPTSPAALPAPVPGGTPPAATPPPAPEPAPPPAPEPAPTGAPGEPAAGPAAAPVPPPPLPTVLRALMGEPEAQREEEAWRWLYRLWGVRPREGENGCSQALVHGLDCLRGDGGIGQLAGLNRPAILRLYDQSGAPRWLVLERLQGRQVTLVAGGARTVVDVEKIADYGIREYALLWRPPAGTRGALAAGDRGPGVAWLAQRLALASGAPADAVVAEVFDAPLAERVRRFQRARGMAADGIAGPAVLLALDADPQPGTPTLSDAPGR